MAQEPQQSTNPTDCISIEEAKATFVARLKAVADAGCLYNTDEVGRLLGLNFRVETSETPSEPHPDGYVSPHLLRKTMTVDGANWYQRTSFGVEEVGLSEFSINRAQTLKQPPKLAFQFRRATFPSDPGYRLITTNSAELEFQHLYSYLKLTLRDLSTLLPLEDVGGVPWFVAIGTSGTDGCSFYNYLGKEDELSGVTLQFSFRVGTEYALSAKIEQRDEAGARYRRAKREYDSRTIPLDRTERMEFIASRPRTSESEMDWTNRIHREWADYIREKCGTVQQLFDREPTAGTSD